MANWAYNTTLGYDDVGETSYTLIGNITEIDEQTLKRANIKTTTLTSANFTETKQAAMIEPGELKLKLQYAKAIHNTLLGIFHNSTPNRDWQITLSDSSTILGTGFISEMTQTPKAVNDAVYEISLTITPTGKWTFTPAV